jgi:hypothetical protein
MDYFSELLESYDKLKKRKFKLTYLSEEDKKEKKEEAPSAQVNKAAEELAKQAISTAKSLPDSSTAQESGVLTPLSRVDGTATSIKIFFNSNQGNVTVLGLQGFAKVVQRDGQIVPEVFKELVGALSSEEKVGGADQTVIDAEVAAAEAAAQAELERLATLEKLGGSFELEGFDPEDLKGTLAHLKQSEKALREFCNTYDKSAELKGTPIYNLCKRTGAYLAGASRSGLEYQLAKGKASGTTLEGKLADADSIKIDPSGVVEKLNPLNPGLLQDVTESHAALTDFLINKGDCDTIQKKVGKFKGSMVLFGATMSEGVAIKPNALQTLALGRAFNKCPDLEQNIAQVTTGKYDSQELNSIRGTFNELTLQLTVRLLAAKTEKERKSAFKEIAKRIDDKRNQLTQYAAQQNIEDGALELDGFLEKEYLLEQAHIGETDTALRNWFVQEVKMMASFVKSIGAVGAKSVGTETATGSKDDTQFIFDDEVAASGAAELTGTIVEKNDDGQWTVGIGQKRYKELQKVKLGETASMRRAMEIFTGDARTDKTIAPGFFARIDGSSMQFPPDQKETRLKAAISWMKASEEKIKNATSILTEPKTYLDRKGNPKSIDPEARISNIAAKIKKELSYVELKQSALGKALFALDGKFKDFSDPKTQQRIQELVQREARFTKLKKTIEEVDKNGRRTPDAIAAQDSLVRLALIAGASVKDMSEFVVLDNGNTHLLSHNAALKAICEANNEKDENGTSKLKVVIKGTTATLIAPNGIKIKYSQDGGWSGKIRTSRGVCNAPKSTVEKLDTLEKEQEESTLHQLLRGQMNLLESILNQSKHSLPL